MTIVLECEFPIFFSYRMPGFSSQYALSSLFPAPSTIKLAIVATAVDYRGIDIAREVFEGIKNAKVGVIPPKKIITVNVLVRRLKAIKDFHSKVLPSNLKLLREGKIGFFSTFERTYGIRGYVQFSEAIKIIIDNLRNENLIRSLATKIGKLGSYDSIVFCRETVLSKDVSIVWAKEEIRDLEEGRYIILPVKDLRSNISFDDINPFSQISKKKKEKVMKKAYYLVPIRKKISGKNWSVVIT